MSCAAEGFLPQKAGLCRKPHAVHALYAGFMPCTGFAIAPLCRQMLDGGAVHLSDRDNRWSASLRMYLSQPRHPQDGSLARSLMALPFSCKIAAFLGLELAVASLLILAFAA